MRNIFEEVKNARSAIARFEESLKELKSHKIAWGWSQPKEAGLREKKKNIMGLFLGLNLGHLGYDLAFNGNFLFSWDTKTGFVFTNKEKDDLIRLVMDGDSWRGAVKEHRTTKGFDEWKKSLLDMGFYQLVDIARGTGVYEVCEVRVPGLLSERFYVAYKKDRF